MAVTLLVKIARAAAFWQEAQNLAALNFKLQRLQKPITCTHRNPKACCKWLHAYPDKAKAISDYSKIRLRKFLLFCNEFTLKRLMAILKNIFGRKAQWKARDITSPRAHF